MGRISPTRFGMLLFALASAGCDEPEDPRAPEPSDLVDAGIYTPYERVVEAYAIDELSSPCEFAPIPQGLQMRSNGRVTLAFRYVFGCTDHAQCTHLRHGLCWGTTGLHCSYPHAEHSCRNSQDCTQFPKPSCDDPESVCAGEECREIGQFCSYTAVTAPCTSDADCRAAPDGKCEPFIAESSCLERACIDDAECGPGALCLCEQYATTKTCGLANCRVDDDCPNGQHCKLTGVWRDSDDDVPTCNTGPIRGFCTTADDECPASCRAVARHPQESECGYDIARGRFACLTCFTVGGP